MLGWVEHEKWKKFYNLEARPPVLSVLWFLLEGIHYQNRLGVLEGKQELTKVVSLQNVKTTIIANPLNS